MSEGQFGAQGAISIGPSTQATDAAATSSAKRERRELAKAYEESPGSWSARARREGSDIFVSGFKTQAAAEKELRFRVAYMEKHGKPHGKGPDRTTVAEALQQHALKHLPSLKGAEQEARRINKYLRAARLGTLALLPTSEVNAPTLLPKGAETSKYFAVWLKTYTSKRDIPQGLAAHRKLLQTKTGGSDRLRAVIANLKVAEVTHENLQDLVRALESEGLAKATIAQEQAMLRRLFYYARTKWHWPRPDTNPACRLKLAGKLTERDVTMSKEQEQRLDEAFGHCVNDLTGPAAQLMTETGMRAQECVGTARWGGVDWEKRILRLEDAKAGPRDVPLSPKAIEILKALGPSEDPDEQIFGITYEALKAGWRRACERAGIKGLRLQDLRHTAATRMALKSGNIFIVQKLTGHKTLNMVERYVNVKAADVVALMHAPEPASHAGGASVASAAIATAAGVNGAAVNAVAASVPGANVAASASTDMSQQALQAAMQMLQAAAAQLNVEAAQKATVDKFLVRPRPAANDASEPDSVAA